MPRAMPRAMAMPRPGLGLGLGLGRWMVDIHLLFVSLVIEILSTVIHETRLLNL